MSDYTSQYLKFLPAVYQMHQGVTPDSDFLTRFLLIFEVLLGRAEDQLPDDPTSSTGGNNTQVTQMPRKGTAMLIDILPDLFYPQLEPLFPEESEYEFLPPFSPDTQQLGGLPLETYQDEILALLNSYVGAAPASNTTTWPALTEEWLSDFLGWMLQWFALEAGQGWGIDQRRGALAGGLTLYRERGTQPGIQAALNQQMNVTYQRIVTAMKGPSDLIATWNAAGVYCLVVTDVAEGNALQVGANTNLSNTYSAGDPILGGIRPYSFLVTYLYPFQGKVTPLTSELVNQITEAVEAQRPAHTQALIQSSVPFVLGQTATVGSGTILPFPPLNS